jgi:hypothetical protein
VNIAVLLAISALLVAKPSIASEVSIYNGNRYGPFDGPYYSHTFSWSGCYIGGEVGALIGNENVANSPLPKTKQQSVIAQINGNGSIGGTDISGIGGGRLYRMSTSGVSYVGNWAGDGSK